jgi:hypothetical protein
MSTKDELERVFPEEKQIGGKHYKLKIQPWTFIRENNEKIILILFRPT